MKNIVVIGAGQAGASATAKLRALGFDGKLTLIGAEKEPPYQRPPLSKAYLLGEMEKERLFLRPREFYADQDIELMLGVQVTGIDRSGGIVLAGGHKVPYDRLILTTGSRARQLPAEIGGDLDGVMTIRSMADIDKLAPSMGAGARVLIVGGGYIGLEAAAVAIKKGMSVTLIETAERILSRVAAPETSDYFRTLHHAQGVDLREGVGLAHLVGGPAVTGAVLTDGTEIGADLVIAGIGILPCDELAAQAGLKVDRGILVDDHGRTSDRAIWAAGDCAVFPYRGQLTRLESVQNAIDQAEAVAENLMGADRAYDPNPWFWSDQYDVKLQIAGLNRGYDAVAVRPGDRDGAVSHWYYADGRLIAVDAMNDPRAYMVGKRLIEAGRDAAPEIVRDPQSNLKSLLTA